MKGGAAWTAFALAVWLAPTYAGAVGDVGGTLVVLTDSETAPNGAWSWFQDERALVDDSDPDNTLLLTSSVSYAPSGGERGDIDLLWVNLDTGERGEFELHDRLERPDDHNSASLWIRPDGRYQAFYSTHNNDNLSRYRISVSPGDPTSWGAEQIVDNNAPTTYSNAYHLPGDNNGAGRTYNFTRASNFDPTILVSEDNGDSWVSNGFKLVTRGGTGDRPYARYHSDGQRIHVTLTEDHPRDFDNSVYHAYVQDGQLFSSTGALLDPNLFNGIANDPTALTPVFETGSVIDGVSLSHAWTTDVSTDAGGNPVTVFTARANGEPEDDHRLLYARFNGSDWEVNQLAKAGGRLDDPAEPDYTGLASIDPNDPNTVYISTDIDPRNDQPTPHYEIFRGQTEDNGATWEWSPITFNSPVDNLRPVVPEWSTEETALLWMRGEYTTFLDFESEIVLLSDIVPLDGVEQRSRLDLNGDGRVTPSDFEVFSQNLFTDLSDIPQFETQPFGDLNNDRVVDFLDFTLFRNGYNAINGARSLEIALAVPEPSSVWLGIGVVFVGRGCGRHALVARR